ncbi:MAG: chemotaxis protein CheW [Clostridia bacterium]|nr:chemotaxis protein CheW [Clostridia bacterium]
MSNRQLLIFKLNGDNYGVEITHIDSIVPTKEIVKVPNTPEYVEGLMSLRGKVYTVFNLRKRFELPNRDFDENTKIVIVNFNSVTVGFIVDEVNEITHIEEENIENTPQAISAMNRKYISGVAKMGDKLVIMLNLEEVLSLSGESVASKA